jgi:hypothetical protein
LPTNHEVCNIECDIDQFKATNMPKNFNYDLGNIAEKTMPEFITDKLLEKIKSKLPQLTLDEVRDVESITKERYRLVEFN